MKMTATEYKAIRKLKHISEIWRSSNLYEELLDFNDHIEKVKILTLKRRTR